MHGPRSRVFRFAASLAIATLQACSTSVAPATTVLPSKMPTNAPVPTPAPGSSAEGGIDLTTLTGRIVFDDGQDIWSINADGTNLEHLTHQPWAEFDPSLSPDGRSIVYRSEPADHPELWVMHADGAGQHQLVPDGGFPAWSPDGSMLAYAPGGGTSGKSSITIANPDGSAPRRLPHTDYGEYPAWSPDGKRIIFNNNLAGAGRMFIVDLDGSRLVDLSSVGQGHEAAWSPDGRSIVFVSQRDRSDNANDVYVMRPDGSYVRRLTFGTGETPTWSPDGRYILFSAPGGFGVMRADGSGLTTLPVNGVGWTTFPDWR